MLKLSKSAAGLWCDEDGDTMSENSEELLEFLIRLPAGTQITVEFAEDDLEDDEEDDKPPPRLTLCEVPHCEKLRDPGSVYCAAHEERERRRRMLRRS